MREQEGLLWIDYDVMKDEIFKLRKIITDLEQNRQALLGTMSAAGQRWESSSAEQFMEITGKQIADLEFGITGLLGIAQYLDETVDYIKTVLDEAKRRHETRN